METEEIVSHIADWIHERMLSGVLTNRKDIKALTEEFKEWLEPEDSTIEIFSLNEY